MEKRDDGGPAFPTPPKKWDRIDEPPLPALPGMSLRDYFAAQALKLLEGWHYDMNDKQFSTVAMMAYRIADALLNERAK